MTRRAKIGGTLGPATDETALLRRLVDAGLDVARLNFSHGSPDEHRGRVRQLRRVGSAAQRQVGLLADLQGPRFRVGRLEDGGLELEEGSTVDLVAGRTRAPSGQVPVAYAALARDVKRGDPILLDDGKLELTVERVRKNVVRCSVRRGGTLTDRKGINLPGTSLSVPALTAKDRRDLALAVELEADWLAVSFVRRAADVRLARRLLRRAGSDMPVMAKIERQEAIDRLDEILAEADGLLVARGDMGVELPTERVPMLQKAIIEAGNAAGKPVMTATQMLDSMRVSRRPTRAEATDVANAVLDGSDCLLLTAETAVGRHPVESVAMMDRIIREAEGSGRGRRAEAPADALSIQVAVCHAGCAAAVDVDARVIVAFTQGGSTASQTARFRPPQPIVAMTPDERVARRLSLSWGVEPRRLPARGTVEPLVRAMERALLREKLVRKGDPVVVLLGSTLGVTGSTNLVLVHRAGAIPSGRGRR